MKFSLPIHWDTTLRQVITKIINSQNQKPVDTSWSLLASLTGVFVLLLIIFQGSQPLKVLISPLANLQNLHSLTSSKHSGEVFGFLPYWNENKADNINFSVLTTLAYFGVPVGADGNLDTTDSGYQTFFSDKSTVLFKKAHANNDRVVLTITQMDNSTIETFLDDPDAQSRAIQQTVSMVSNRGIDGVNVDFEYVGTPDSHYRQAYSTFIKNLSSSMHTAVPSSKVSVSVYATAAISQKLYDIAAIAKYSDNIFMMGYDFATASSDYAMPTDPLYGANSGKYFYDLSTAVSDFKKVMPANKLILGLPTYGYNYVVDSPEVKAQTLPYWDGQAYSQTYSDVQANVTPAAVGSNNYREGWDDEGKVGWKAYYDSVDGVWRMVFIDNPKSLQIKFSFAKEQNLAGVGLWALGNDNGSNDIWAALSQSFGGNKIADREVLTRQISDNSN